MDSKTWMTTPRSSGLWKKGTYFQRNFTWIIPEKKGKCHKRISFNSPQSLKSIRQFKTHCNGMDLHDSLCDLLHVLLRGNALQVRIHNFTEIEYRVNQLHITMIRKIFYYPVWWRISQIWKRMSASNGVTWDIIWAECKNSSVNNQWAIKSFCYGLL